jgi:peptide/nickel transport system ATP-binding protein
LTDALLLTAQNLTQTTRPIGQKRPITLFSSVAFDLAAGQSLAIVGQPGGALRALARTVGAIEAPAGGQLLFEGQAIAGVRGGRLRELRRRLQYVSGGGRQSLSPYLSLFDALAEPLNIHRLGPRASRRAQVEATARLWGLNAHMLVARPRALSEALCQRAVLARAFVMRPRLLVCDEPASRLEPSAAAPLLAAIAEACRSVGMAWLWTTTDAALARAFADRTFRLTREGLQPA